MGGNALKHLQPVRLTSAEVVEVVHHLQRNWQLCSPDHLYLVPWVAEKADHGDIDLICAADPEVVRRFAERQGIDPAAIRANDTVLSTPVPLPWDAGAAKPRVVQVDFICCDAAAAPAARFFYAGGDFGMLLGRVAAWNGLVFGMDGLRYRAERGHPWQSDVHLTADPAEILTVLGYPPRLPWFATYDRLWRFILSSPLAGPWMFMPAATNAENRSRDRQRRTVGDFQAWLAANHPDRLTAPALRATPLEAQAWVERHFPTIAISAALDRQKAAFDYAKLRTRLLGLGAVEEVIGAGHPAELMGELVREMQPLLPPRAEREAALGDRQRWSDQVRLARAAAAAVAARRGIAVRESAPLPAFVPPP
jgi:hypothetical protein